MVLLVKATLLGFINTSNSKMNYSAKHIANYFLHKYGKIGGNPQIIPLKLQKLVYISHGWSLGLLDKPLVSDEHAEAWKYGPVFSSLYSEFKDYGGREINRYAISDNYDFDFGEYTPMIKAEDEESSALLDRVWEVYGGYTPIQLSNMTHKKDSPWYKAKSQSKGIKNHHIDNEIIKKYYKELANG